MSILTENQKKALGYKKHISLTANAGSGKTFVFSKRYVEIAINENVDLDRIVAITFTEKAAAELYSRIAKEIGERLKTETDKSKIYRLERMRQNLVSANISTIHSFCINILKENAPDAGLDVNFIPIDETVSDELIEKSIEELFKAFIQSGILENEIKYLIRIFGSKFTLVKELTSAIKNRKNIFYVKDTVYKYPPEKIAENFGKIFREKLEKYLASEVSKVIDYINEINNFVFSPQKENETVDSINRLMLEVEETKETLDKIKILQKVSEFMLTKSGTVKKRGYLSAADYERFSNRIDFIHNFFDSVKNLEMNKDTEVIEKQLALFGLNFLKVFEELFGIYQKKKSENAYLDYEDMLLFTEQLIQKPRIQEKLRAKYEYIMIDEYQDTNEVQYNIFMPILENLRKGNLFVVGDEKQSIYMFRGAELEVFNKTKVEISKDGTPLVLPHSFRMAPNIAGFTNHVFEKLFESPNLDFNEVEYEKIVCAYNKEGEGYVEFLIAEKDNEGQTESEMVTAKIIDLVKDKKVEYGDIAILCRKRSAFDELEKEFVKYDIPYVIIGGKGFYQKQIIYDISNYLTFLINPNDDKAFVGMLRSPFYTFSDAELFEMSLYEGESFFEKFRNYSAQNKKASEILDLINSHVQESFSSNFAKLIRKICEDTGYWSVLAAKRNSAQEIANLEKIISIANAFSNQSFATLYDFVNYLSESIVKTDDEGQAKILENTNAVSLMTLHKAKGLEFKVVFLFKTADKTQQDRTKSKSIRVDKNFGIMTKVPLNSFFESYKAAPVVWLSDYVQHRKEMAETKRLLYVGVTRAEQYLFVSATANKGKFPRNSFADFLFGTLERDRTENGYLISTGLTVAGEKDGKFVENEIKLNFNIPVTNELEIGVNGSGVKSKTDFPIKINIGKITDIEKNEIISASKIAVFSQCPVKYKLTYELGYSKLHSLNKRIKNIYEFNYKEDDEEILISGDVQGRIIHSLLEKEVKEENLQNEIENLLVAESVKTPGLKNEIVKIKNRIFEKVLRFYRSEEYNFLKQFDAYKNEYEIYTAENDYFLYGIVDKLIVLPDKIIIVDYKSDEVNNISIRNKVDGYLNQLKFYAYVLSKAHPQIDNFELRLIFIVLPDKTYVKNITRKELNIFGGNVKNIVEAIRKSDFQPNLSHCKFCHFSDEEGKCILKTRVTVAK